MSVVAKHSNNRISAKAPFQVALVEALVNPAAVFTALDESTMRLSDPDSGITVLFEGRLMEVDAEGAPKGIAGRLEIFPGGAARPSVTLSFDEVLMPDLVTLAGLGSGAVDFFSYGAFYNALGTGVVQEHAVNGSNKADVLEPFGSIKQVFGRGGNDTFLFYGSVDYNGGKGRDVLDLSHARGKTAVDLEKGLASDGDISTLTSIEGVKGGGFDDKLTGDGKDNMLDGGRGDDELRGGGGMDRLVGGAGKDKLWGNAGADILLGGNGNDRLIGGGGADMITGGKGRDVIKAGGGRDTVYVHDNKDKINGGSGSDTISGEKLRGVDSLNVDLQAETYQVIPSLGAMPRGLFKFENAIGSRASDVLSGDGKANTLEGKDGNDILLGRGGDDTLRGGRGDDILSGGNGTDILDGGEGADGLEGGAGDDVMTGGEGPDRFHFIPPFKNGDPQPGAGDDTITDFNPEEDKIYVGASKDQVDAKVIRQGGDAVILFDDVEGNSLGSVTVEGGAGFSNEQLLPDWFGGF